MKKWFTGVLAGVLVVGLVSSALASDHNDQDLNDAPVDTPVVTVDEDAGTVTIAIPLDGELPECAPVDEPAAAPDEVVTDEDIVYAAGDCISLEVEHPSGKLHHGAIVSTVAKNLHPSMIDGLSKGEIMRIVAKTKHIDPDEDDIADDEDDGAGPPAHAKDKSKNKGNNGNGNGKAKKDK